MSKQNMTAIDPVKLRAFVFSKGVENVTKMLGKSRGYFDNVYYRRTMPTNVLNAMCTIYGIYPKDIKPDPPKPAPVIHKSGLTASGIGVLAGTLANYPKRVMPSTGYALDLDVQPDYVSLRLVEDSKVIKHAKARIKKEDETATQFEIVQAISYAAHLIYKFVEQDEIGT